MGECMISNASRVWEIRKLGLMSGDRKRGQGGDEGTGMAARAAGELLLPLPSTSVLPLDSTVQPVSPSWMLGSKRGANLARRIMPCRGCKTCRVAKWPSRSGS